MNQSVRHVAPPLNGGSIAPVKPSTPELLSDVASEAKNFVLTYGELIKYDLRVELNDAKRAAVTAVIGAFSISIGVMLLSVAMALALAQWLAWPAAAGFAVVGAAVTLVAGVAFWITKERAKEVESPDEALEELGEDTKWIAENV